MINLQIEVKGEKLHIIVDLSQEHGRSKSGKTVTIAITQGNQKNRWSGGGCLGGT